MEDIKGYRPVYALPLFTWLLLLLATPVGLFFLWYHRHYNFLVRIVITLAFVPNFKPNMLISLAILVLIIFQLLGYSYHDLERLFIEREKIQADTKEGQTEYTLDDLTQWDENTYRSVLKLLMVNFDYVENQNETLMKGYIFQRKNKRIGLLFYVDEPITREAIYRSVNLLINKTIDHLIMFTNHSVTLYAEETSRQFEDLSIWTNDHLLYLLQYDS